MCRSSDPALFVRLKAVFFLLCLLTNSDLSVTTIRSGSVSKAGQETRGGAPVDLQVWQIGRTAAAQGTGRSVARILPEAGVSPVDQVQTQARTTPKPQTASPSATKGIASNIFKVQCCGESCCNELSDAMHTQSSSRPSLR